MLTESLVKEKKNDLSLKETLTKKNLLKHTKEGTKLYSILKCIKKRIPRVFPAMYHMQ